MLLKAKNVILLRKNHSAQMITPGEVFEVDEGTAKRYLETNAAVKAVSGLTETAGKAPAAQTPNGNTPSGENAQETPKTGIPVDDENNTMDRAYLETLSFSELKEIAKSFGVYSGTMRSKESVIEALTSIPVSDDDDDLPDLTPQDVVEE